MSSSNKRLWISLTDSPLSLRWHTLDLISTLKPGSQYDTRTSVASRVSGWCWNRLYFYSSVASWALASIQPIRLSKNFNIRAAIWLMKRNFFLDAHNACGSSVILWTRLNAWPPCSLRGESTMLTRSHANYIMQAWASHEHESLACPSFSTHKLLAGACKDAHEWLASDC